MSGIYFCFHGCCLSSFSQTFGYDTNPLCHALSTFDDVAFISHNSTTSGIFFLFIPPFLAMVKFMLFPHLLLDDTSQFFAVSPVHAIQLFWCPRSTDDPRPCQCCMPRRHVVMVFLFNRASIGSNHIPSYTSSSTCFFAHFLPRKSHWSASKQCLLMSSGHASFIPIILPSANLRTYQHGPVTPKSFISEKTAPAGPLALIHEFASHTCLFHAFLISSSYSTVQTACAQTHVVAHASSCSISRLLARGVVLLALATCLRNTLR